MIRSVIFQLEDICAHSSSQVSVLEHLPLLSKLLQGVEEKVEIELTQRSMESNLILSTPRPSSSSSSSSFPPLRTSRAEGIRSVLKVFMSNQLDLNQSELEYYENVINDCIERLETIEAELTTEKKLNEDKERQISTLTLQLETAEGEVEAVKRNLQLTDQVNLFIYLVPFFSFNCCFFTASEGRAAARKPSCVRACDGSVSTERFFFRD